MYTIVLRDDNILTTTVQERVMQRSKMVNSLHFLVEPTYQGQNMADFVCMLQYCPPISREPKSEILSLSDELYKDMLEYKLPLDTNLTMEAGDVQLNLTFVRVEMLADGTGIQYVRKTQDGTLKVLPISAWSNFTPDAALNALDQRLVEEQILINQLVDANAAMADGKADGLKYDAGRLQLTARGKAIGNTVQITDSGSDPEDGTIRVVEF